MNGVNIRFILLLVIQIILSSVLNLSQFVMLTILPTMILFLPTEKNTESTLFLAFAVGLITDFLSNGMIGLTAASILPVAFARTFVMRLIFGSELFVRNDNLSISRQGLPKIFTAILILTAIFLFTFILLESSGTRRLSLCAIKFAASLLLSSGLSIFAANILRSNS